MGSDLSNDFNRVGHPGKYWKVIKHSGGITDYTGSLYGAGAIYISGSGFSSDDYVRLSGGGDISLFDLRKNSYSDLYELSVSQISSSAVSPGVYVLFTNKPRGVI